MNRAKKLKLNIATSLTNQLAGIVSGFVLPNFFLSYYGSAVNGLVTSITHFLAVISLCECGVGAVVQAALYKPIAENDSAEISRIYKSSSRFFGKISKILIGYMIILMIVFPLIINKEFSPFSTGLLIFAVTVSMLAQYYFAITYKLILNAAQLTYIQMSVGAISTVLNIVLSIALMKAGAGIQTVKLVSSTIFLIQPLIYKKAVEKHFIIDKKITLESEPIKQKWNGLAQHIATVILENTDVMILTFFSSLSNVSIYGVYHLVTNGIKLMFTTIANNMKSLLGDMLARNEKSILDKTFSRFEWLTHSVVTFTYSCTGILIVPFVRVYTRHIEDASIYSIPLFGFLMCFAMFVYTIRLPYSQLILAAGHFKQTQTSAIIETILNIAISIFLVSKFGLIGVAIGTIIAMTYRTLYFVWYLSKNIVNRKIEIFLNLIISDAVIALGIYFATRSIKLETLSYLSWLIMALKVVAIAFVITVLVSLVFSGKEFLKGIKEICGKIRK